MKDKKHCWNCDSNKYIETATSEHCSDCGIECYYHGSGMNEAYIKAREAKWARERTEQK